MNLTLIKWVAIAFVAALFAYMLYDVKNTYVSQSKLENQVLDLSKSVKTKEVANNADRNWIEETQKQVDVAKEQTTVIKTETVEAYI